MSTENITIDHELKCLTEFYPDVVNGNKPFEVRRDDRNFKIGDVIKLNEVETIALIPKTDFISSYEEYTGRTCTLLVTYKLTGERWGIKDGYCVLGVKRISL